MTKEHLEKLREWIKAEVDYGVASREEDSEGYRESAHDERNEADRLFKELINILT